MASGGGGSGNDLVLGQKIGQGGFGVVFRAVWRGKEVAVKRINASIMPINEILPMKKELKHANVINIYAVIDKSIIMELCHKNLHAFLTTDPRPGEPRPKDVPEGVLLLQIASGLSYLHDNNVVHRDLKPDNVLVNFLRRNPYVQVKLCDFGLSANMDARTHISTVAGVAQWLGPEYFTDDGAPVPRLPRMKHSEHVDIYSTAKIFCTIIARPEDRDGIMHISCGQLMKMNKWQFKDYRLDWSRQKAGLPALIKDMMAVDPDERPSAAHVLATLQRCFQPEGTTPSRLMIGGGLTASGPVGAYRCVWQRQEGGSWQRVRDLSMPPAVSVAPIPGGFVVVGPGKEVKLCELDDRGRWVWRTLPAMLEDRRWSGVVYMPREGRVYILGGVTGIPGRQVKYVDCYELPRGRGEAALVDLGQGSFHKYSCRWPIVAASGHWILNVLNTDCTVSSPHRRGEPIPAELYDARNNTWTQNVAPLPADITSTHGATATAFPGQPKDVYVVGAHTRLCTRYTIPQNTWTLLSQPLSRHAYPAVHVSASSGMLLLCGGEDSGGSVEQYDQDQDVWTPVTWSMPQNRCHHFLHAL